VAGASPAKLSHSGTGSSKEIAGAKTSYARGGEIHRTISTASMIFPGAKEVATATWEENSAKLTPIALAKSSDAALWCSANWPT
jgi:hypothetical protein